MNGKGLVIAAQTNVPTIAWGKPGTGKTSFIVEFANKMGRHLETVIASIREPSDFAGLPVIQDDGTVKLAPPDWAKRVCEMHEKGIPSIVFLDELSTAPPAVQAALLRPVFEGVIGDLELPKDTWWIAAANPVETTSGVWALSPALANRFIHLDWNLEGNAWIEGMINGWNIDNEINHLPDGWEEGISHTKSMLASFIKARPTLLLQQPKNTDEAGRAWASPRSWENASFLITAARSVGLDSDLVVQLLAGCVGRGAAVEYLTWERELDLPDPESLLKNPDSLELPERGDQIFAILSSVVARVREKNSEARWNTAWQILGHAAKEGHADIAAIPAKALAKARPSKKTPLPKDIKEFVPVLSAAGLIGDK